MGEAGDLLARDPDQILLYEPVKIFPLLLVFLIFERGLGFHGRIGKTLQVTELEPPGTVHIVLQGRLGKEQ